MSASYISQLLALINLSDGFGRKTGSDRLPRVCKAAHAPHTPVDPNRARCSRHESAEGVEPRPIAISLRRHLAPAAARWPAVGGPSQARRAADLARAKLAGATAPDWGVFVYRQVAYVW